MSYDNDTLVTMTLFALTANFGTALIDHTGFRPIQALEKIGLDHSLRPFMCNNLRGFTLSCLSVLTLVDTLQTVFCQLSSDQKHCQSLQPGSLKKA